MNKINECWQCDCYDEDYGCTMPSIDKLYACPLKSGTIEFFIPMIPPTVTAQEHKVTIRNGKPIFYDPPEIKDAKQKILSGLYPHKPKEPFTDGVRLIVKWLFPKGRHKDGEYRTSKPDTDNLQKMLKDCMTKSGFWKDDALVCSEICEKFWTDKSGIYIKVEKI